MKVILRNYGIRMSSEQRQVAKSQAADMTRTRGTGKLPVAPRDVIVQSGPRGLLVSWILGEGFTDDVAGFRIYKDNELTQFAEIRDPSTTQHYIETTAGSTPPNTNIFVSSLNKLGQESPLVAAQGASLVEAGAPVFPPTPPTHTGCPLSGAPVKLYGKPEWWSLRIVACREFFQIVTETGRKGTFSRPHRAYCHRGLLPLLVWQVGDRALTDDGEEIVESIEALELENATVDRYEASEGHIYSAWGFVGHNIKKQP